MGSPPLVSESLEQVSRDLAFAEHELDEIETQIGAMSRGGQPFLERLMRERSRLKLEIVALRQQLESISYECKEDVSA